MNDNNKHTSPLLFFLCFLFCVFTASVVTRPTAGFPPVKDASFTASAAGIEKETAGEGRTEESLPGETSAETTPAETASGEESPAEAVPAEEAAPEEAPEEEASPEAAPGEEIPEQETAGTDAPAEAVPAGENAVSPSPSPAEEAPSDSSYTVSPEAAAGSWSKAGGEWFFVTDGGNYHGWLNDTDGHVYYLNPENGVMTTGWLDLEGKRYYFNADGVMQTGDIEIDGQICHFSSEGVLESSEQAAEPQPEIVITAAPG